MSKFVDFFKKVFSFLSSPGVKSAIEEAAKLIPEALTVVEIVAKMTPNRVDDELVALAKFCGVPEMAASWTSMPLAERGFALLQAAVKIMQAKAPSATTSVITLAVQTAYTKYKAEVQ